MKDVYKRQDQYAVTLQKDTRITLNQFVGQEGLQISKALSTSCVNFASDASSYTIPQAISKMKARRVFVVLGANDVDGSVSVDSFIADYKQFLQSIRSAYAYCDIIAVGIQMCIRDRLVNLLSRSDLVESLRTASNPHRFVELIAKAENACFAE